jgi:hypothetical protein
MTWNVAEDWDEIKWKEAYAIFRKNEPLKTINNELKYLRLKAIGMITEFSILTQFPKNLGFFHDVDKRAILLVISRSRSMYMYDWNDLRDLQPPEKAVKLALMEKLSINGAMAYMEVLKQNLKA